MIYFIPSGPDSVDLASATTTNQETKLRVFNVLHVQVYELPL